MDADLRLLDVTGDGVPEILFNSGSQGASEGIIAEHVLRYESSIGTFKDISLDAFYNSGRNANSIKIARGSSKRCTGMPSRLEAACSRVSKTPPTITRPGQDRL